jgi:hypothetical protein
MCVPRRRCPHHANYDLPPIKIEENGGRTLGPLKMLSRTIGATHNKATFDGLDGRSVLGGDE